MRIIFILTLLLFTLNLHGQELSLLNCNHFNNEIVKIDTLSPEICYSADKGQHFIGSFISTLFISKFNEKYFNFNHSKSKNIGIGISFSIGLSKEILDSQKPRNFFSFKDLVANIAGILAASAILEIK